MDSSVNSHSKKRKNFSSSNPLNGRFTRSKSQINVHVSRSGRSWSDAPARKPFHKAQSLSVKIIGNPRNVDHPLPETVASLDLRARARRIFSPAGVIEEESAKFEIESEFSEDGCNGVSDNCEKLDSDLGIACYGKEEDGVREDPCSVSKDMDPDLDLGSHGQRDKEENVNLNEKTPTIESKVAESEFESGKDWNKIQANGSISAYRSVLNSSYKRKVFKAPSSFSYRRLLPFLMEMAKEDSNISKFDVIDVGYPGKVQNLNNVDSNQSPALMNSYAGNRKDTDDHTKKFNQGDYQNSSVQHKGQDLDDPTKNVSKAEGNVGLSAMEQTNHENMMNGVDEVEEVVQTTPPDDTILSKLDSNNTGVSREISYPQSGNQVLRKPSNGKSSTNVLSSSVRSHSARKSNTISNAKMVLSPCSRSKIYKTSSFSYRRLLPFLTDVAKSNANISEPPKSQLEEDDGRSGSKVVDENVPVNSIRTDDFPGNQDSQDQEPSARPINLSVSSSSNGIGANMSTPLFSSSDSLLSVKSISACSEAIAKPDMPLLGITWVKSDSEKLETELPTNNIQSCPSEAICSTEKSCSTINQESLTKESKSDSSLILEIELPTKNIESCPSEATRSAEKSYSTLSQDPLARESNSDVPHVSELETTDAGKECIALGLEYEKAKLQLIQSVYQSSLEIEELEHKGNHSDSPTRGILKKNPRGCRGLCNCLNCSSFRLHAERSFEFSKNQMLDAEEVAQGLITELAELRNLLEKSVSCGSDLHGIQINQAKEACKRALKTEQLSKARLRQMIVDLNIHSRVRPLQRPRVTFSR